MNANQPVKLDGINPLSYLGVNPYTPCGMYGQKRNPAINDFQGYQIGDFWMNLNTFELFYLAAKNIGGVPSGRWIPLSTPAGGGILTITGNDAVAVAGDALQNINLIGSSPFVFSGNPGLHTVTLSTDGTLALSYNADSGTATPALGVLNLFGSTHVTSTASGHTVNYALTGFTPNAMVYGALTGDLLSFAVATNGQIPIGRTGNSPLLNTITAGAGITVTNGVGTITIAATGGGGGIIQTLQGDSGTASAATVNVLANATAGQSIFFIGDNVATLRLSVTDLGNNTMLGFHSGNAGMSGVSNTALGYNTGTSLTTGFQNCLLGTASGNLLTQGVSNTLIGVGSGASLTTGGGNCLVGYNSGANYTGGESNNILLSSIGVLGDNNTTRIGNSLTGSTFIRGVQGVDIGSIAEVVTVNTSSQFGSKTLTAGPNITITPAAHTITISATTSGGPTYSTGTWVPVLTWTSMVSTPPTFSYSNANYVQIGRFVQLMVNILITNAGGTSATDTLNIAGLPFSFLSAIEPCYAQCFSSTGGVTPTLRNGIITMHFHNPLPSIGAMPVNSTVGSPFTPWSQGYLNFAMVSQSLNEGAPSFQINMNISYFQQGA